MAALDRDALLAQIRMVTLLEDTNVTDAEIVLLINQGVDEISIADYWPFLEASATVTITDSTQGTNLPSDFEYQEALVDDDKDEVLPYIAPSLFFSMVGNDTGNEATDPKFYTIWAGQFLFSPVPKTTDSARYTTYYYKSGTQLSAGSTDLDWHEGFHQIIVEYVKWKLWDREEYFDQSERAFITYSRYLMAMKSFYSRRTRRMPGVAGDGHFQRPFGDPNVPLLNN
jgi:hypothetical protein